MSAVSVVETGRHGAAVATSPASHCTAKMETATPIEWTLHCCSACPGLHRRREQLSLEAPHYFVQRSRPLQDAQDSFFLSRCLRTAERSTSPVPATCIVKRFRRSRVEGAETHTASAPSDVSSFICVGEAPQFVSPSAKSRPFSNPGPDISQCRLSEPKHRIAPGKGIGKTRPNTLLPLLAPPFNRLCALGLHLSVHRQRVAFRSHGRSLPRAVCFLHRPQCNQTDKIGHCIAPAKTSTKTRSSSFEASRTSRCHLRPLVLSFPLCSSETSKAWTSA